MALEDEGYLVVTAENGLEGLAVLKSDAAIDMLVSDVMMPKMDGPTMVRASRMVGPTLPILFITGYSADLLSTNILLDDRISVLKKPFQISDLTTRVQKALA